ncbi:MAG: hypothetical protein R3F20_03845 [Planctomycetota bacterium]
MRRPILLMALFATLTATSLAAQAGGLAPELAAAVRAEETEPAAERVLALYDRLAARDDLGPDAGWRIEAGRGRLLLRLGRLDEVDAALTRLAGPAETSAAAREVRDELARRLAGAAGNRTRRRSPRPRSLR